LFSRLIALYKMERIPPETFLLTSASYLELLRIDKFLRVIINFDARLIDTYRYQVVLKSRFQEELIQEMSRVSSSKRYAQAAFELAFDVPLLEHAAPLAGVLVLGAVGLAGAGTLFGAVAVRTRFRELVLPLLLLPLLVPVLISAVRATAGLLETGALPAAPLRLLLVADAVFWIASYVLFEFVLDE